MNRDDATGRITIAPAQELDYDWAAHLMSGSDPWITLGRRLAQCQAAVRRPRTELFVARDAGRPLGFVLLDPYGCAGSPYILSIAVDAHARSQGIGSRLLTFAERCVVGCRFVFLCVSSFNLRAQQLYLRRGYERVGEFPNYVIDGQCELLLMKKLT